MGGKAVRVDHVAICAHTATVLITFANNVAINDLSLHSDFFFKSEIWVLDVFIPQNQQNLIIFKLYRMRGVIAAGKRFKDCKNNLGLFSFFGSKMAAIL